jgi:hypothetical protein
VLAGAPQVLSDPAFISRSKDTLANLTNVPLWPGADLAAFTGLRVLMLLVRDRQADAAAAAMAPPPAPGAAVLEQQQQQQGLEGEQQQGEAEGEEGGRREDGGAELLRSARLPAGLESLCLSAEGVQAPQDFSAGEARHACCWRR